MAGNHPVNKRPFAVFDIDGTLIRWQLYHALADELAREGHLDAEPYRTVKATRMTWKKRATDSSFRLYEEALVKLVDDSIQGIKVNDLNAACRRVIDEYKDQVYTYTRDLIEQLRGKNYLLFTISASQQQIVSLIAEHYGFDDSAGTVYATRDGVFTGEKDLLLRDRKPEKLRELVAKHGGVWQCSVGVGDSEGDIPMLSVVEQPVAFNPTRALFDHAKANDWQIVVERKNVIYTLESRDGSYLLA